ncbi:hypothetical protein Tco_0748526 [Tanacetum coccineum]|uniref:Uncharacterized protein n=1 Tax=Tanacetum coccineum TaxID=301880 RepID=A0ABQ4YYM7_9ASTR
MASSQNQSIADAGLENHPPMLEKGSYVPWSSRFLRYIDGKKDYGKMIKDSIFKANIDAMNAVLLGIPNDIYNSVDACKTAQAMATSKKTYALECAYTVYPILPAIPNQSRIIWEVEFFEGWKPLSPLQLAVEEVMSE